MKKISFVLFVIALFLLPTQGLALKIQTGDSWIYTDNFGNTYNETATGQPYNSFGQNWASVSINTSRPYPFAYYNYSVINGKSLENTLFNYSSIFYFEPYQTLEVTQLGGIPLASRNKFTAVFQINDQKIVFTPSVIGVGNGNQPINSLYWLYGNNDPQSCFSTTQSIGYEITQYFLINSQTNIQIMAGYTISSLSNNAENFTVQYSYLTIAYQSPTLRFNYNILSPVLQYFKIDSNEQTTTVPDAYSFILPNNSLMPNIIVQTQPVPIGPNSVTNSTNFKISAQNQLNNYHNEKVTYTLNNPKNSSKTANPVVLPVFLFSFAVIVIIRRKK